MKKSLLLFGILALAGLALASFAPRAAAVTLTPGDISWEMVGTDMVRFHLHFHNDDPVNPSAAVSGTVYSQEFGAFLPHYGTIGVFEVPPIEPESFFDVYFEVPLSSLPPSPGPLLRSGLGTSAVAICPPPMWVGNVDVTWVEPGGPVQVNAHYGDVGVCPGGPPSCLHVLTGCAGNLTWAIGNVCQGWTVTLVNEDMSAAPALLPPGWTGYICVSADGTVAVGASCCFWVDLTCGGSTGRINVCAYACECPTATSRETWGRLKMLYR